MRFKSIEALNEGDIVGSELYDFDGRVVVARGVRLSTKLIERMSSLGFSGAYINDDLSADVDIPVMISAPLRNEARACLESGNIDDALKYARRIIEEIISNKVVSLDLADLRSYNDYTYAHSVNVAVLSCILGLALKISVKDLENLVLAALLHDIGKTMVPKEILTKPDRLTKEEYEIMKTHPVIAHEMLSSRYDIPVMVKNAILFHHENMDGSGYPDGKAGDDISEITRIIHIVDVYDALTSDRPYKKGYSSKEAAEYLMGGCGIMFDQRIVDTFIKTIPLYPLGTEVLLSNGERAIVIENRGLNNLRPIVRIIKTYQKIDLSSMEYNNLVIYSGNEAERIAIERGEKARKQFVEESIQKNILIVDDMRANIAMLQSILSYNYKLKAVTSGMDAIKEIQNCPNKYDMILMDIAMPLMLGTEAAAKINEISNKKIPILFVSTKCDKETVLACKQLDAAGYVLRPYRPIFLLEEIERVLSSTSEY